MQTMTAFVFFKMVKMEIKGFNSINN
jgi:hypothetical protein